MTQQMILKKKELAAFYLFIFLSTPLAYAAEDSYSIIIQNHRFSPEELVVPAGQKIKIQVMNQDTTPEEFESYDLNREKIVGANGKITLFVGPLKPGRYEYFGEFHQDTAKAAIVAKEGI